LIKKAHKKKIKVKDFNQLFIGDINRTVTKEDLEQFFTESGVLFRDVRLMRNYAYVVIEDPSNVQKALALNDRIFQGRPIRIEISKALYKPPTAFSEDCRTVFLPGLGLDVTEDDIREFFKDFDDITRIKIMNHGAFRPGALQFAFVDFFTSQSVLKAVGLNGEKLKDRAINIDFDSGKKKDHTLRRERPVGWDAPNRGRRSSRRQRNRGKY